MEKKFEDLKQLIDSLGLTAREYFTSALNPNEQKGDGSIVTEIDKRIEGEIRSFISENFPKDTIVGEEDDTVSGNSGYVWYIDPIDGTENFVRKIPFFAITATRLGPGPEGSFAIVHNPVTGQTFSSYMEDGAYENKNICFPTNNKVGSRHAINVSGNSKNGNEWVRSARTALWKAIYEKYGKSGSLNCALLECAYVSADRLDGFLSMETEPWDCAAGLYLIKASGGSISYYDNGWIHHAGAIKDIFGESHERRRTIFVSHPEIHDEFLNFIGNPESWAD